MIIQIELPTDEERTLVERARLSGRDIASYVRGILRDHLGEIAGSSLKGKRATAADPMADDLIDEEAVASCEDEADDAITLEEVRAATSGIKDSMARVVIEEERAERF